MATFGFIGMGNMGYAILKGVLKEYAPEEVLFSDGNVERVEAVTAETGVPSADSNAACVSKTKYVILAVKPQQYDTVQKSIVNILTPEHVVISIAPGITIAELKRNLGIDRRVVRAMPNTPALIGEGMTGACYDPECFTAGEQEIIKRFFESFGKVRFVDEKLMDAVVCASGSSPAYVYLFIEALADSVVKQGMPRDIAYEMAAQTVAGSARLFLESGEHPGKLKDQVCSPGGTTIAAVAALEEHGFRNAVIKAGDACYAACKKFS